MDFSYFTCIPMVAFNTASLTAAYQALNGSGFSQDIKILKLYNAGSTAITISFDGVNDHDFLPNGQAPIILNFQSNHACNSSYGSGTLFGRQGQVIYGKGAAGTGNLYIIGYR